MKRISIFITEKQKSILNSQSEHDGLPVAEHIRRAIDNYIRGLKNDYGRKLEQTKKTS